MRTALATIGLVAALAACAPIAAEAGGNMRGPQSRGHSSHSYRPYPYAYPYFYRPYFYRPYYYSSYYYAPPAYVVTPGYYYSAPPGFYSPPAAPQIQREVVFPEGRYFLQGDGDAVPYRWVWVPNPPTAPPADTQDPR
jgi:hypothetical protein